MIGIKADLGGQVKRNRQSRLPFFEQVAIALVGFHRAAEPGVLPHGPEASAVHRGIDASGVGKFAGSSNRNIGLAARKILRGIDGLQGNAAKRLEAPLAFT